MSKIPSQPLQTEIWARCLGLCIFSCSRENCIFYFQFPFWNSINLAHVPQLGEEDLVYEYLFTSQRQFHFFPDMDFSVIPSLIWFHLELSIIELPKLTSSILIEIVTISVVLVYQLFLYTPAHKGLIFEKVIF